MVSVTYGAACRCGKALSAMIFMIVLAVALSGAARAETLRILAMGDSLTAGYQLPAGAGLAPQLEAWLKGRGRDVEIVGAGVSGDTTAGGLARLDWALGPEIDGIIIELGANDALRGIAPEVARRNLTAMVETARQRGLEVLIVGVPVPGNFGEDYRQAFLSIWPDLAREYDALLYRDYFAALGDDRDAAQAFLLDDGMHPNAEGVRRVVAALGPKVEELIARIEAR